MKRADFRFLERLRVRWAEVDLQKIVFNGHYLMYFDTAVAGYWRALAMPYHETMEHLQGDLFVRKATVEYLASARYDDLCDVGIRAGRIGKSSMVFECALFRGDALLVTGELVYVFADPAAMASRPVPEALRQVLHDFEAGQPMLELRTGTWDACAREARRLRQAVFVAEQGIAGLAEDAADTNAVHTLAFNRFGHAVATGRWIDLTPETAQVGRLAVAQPLRGSGVGRQVLAALVASAREAGKRELLLHAAASATDFYRRAGFEPRGAPFEEAGLPHQTMVRTL